MKVLKWIGITIAVLALAFVAIGFAAPKHYEGVKIQHYNASADELWAIVTDVEGIADRHTEVVRVEVLEKDAYGPTKWKEHFDMGDAALFERTVYQPKEKYEVKMLESGFSMKGTWTYEVQSRGDHSGLTIYEDRTLDSWLYRAMFAITGNDGIMQMQVNSFKDALGEK